MQLRRLSIHATLITACILLQLPLLHAQLQTADTSLASSKRPSQSYSNVSGKSLKFINDKYAGLSNTIDEQTEKVLERMQRREAKLQSKLQGIDSNKAKQVFANSQVQYQQLQAKLQSPVTTYSARLREYIPNIDSIKTTLGFLSQNSNTLPGMSPDKLAQVQAASGQVLQLEGRLQQANEAQQFIRDREAYLKQALANTPLVANVNGLNQEVYYYQQRLQGYKDMANDPQKLGEQLLAVASAMPAFQKFFSQNSYLSQLFQMPGTQATAALTAGLQTKAGVAGILSQRLGAGTTVGPQLIQQKTQEPGSPIADLKNKLSQLGSGSAGNSDATVPDFKPNTQHTKTFLKRLQWGFNIQSVAATGVLPATTDLALTLGYKVSDTKTVGIGASYNLGLGYGFSNIHFSNEGVGLRSFADIKIKGSIWATGGFEYTYYQAFARFSELYNLDVWQKSALAGLAKKYSIGKNREGSIQVLYDFLADKEIPIGQAIKFRLGYSF